MILSQRSWMFVPGNSAKMIGKALSLDLDVAMLDLEDGVVPELKATARPIVSEALNRPHTGRPLRFVRVNAFGLSELALDLEAVVCAGLDGIVLPKVETVEQVASVERMLEIYEKSRKLHIGKVRMMLAIETAKAIVAAPHLAAASPRVCGLMFGAEDFSKDIGLPTFRTGHARDFLYVRSAIAIAARAAGIVAIDGVWPAIKDGEGLERDAILARDLGFSGKSMIHPGQIALVNKVFSPSESEVDFAKKLIADFEVALANGQGSISFSGELVDRPIYERALATLRAGSTAPQSA